MVEGRELVHLTGKVGALKEGSSRPDLLAVAAEMRVLLGGTVGRVVRIDPYELPGVLTPEPKVIDFAAEMVGDLEGFEQRLNNFSGSDLLPLMRESGFLEFAKDLRALNFTAADLYKKELPGISELEIFVFQVLGVDPFYLRTLVEHFKRVPNGGASTSEVILALACSFLRNLNHFRRGGLFVNGELFRLVVVFQGKIFSAEKQEDLLGATKGGKLQQVEAFFDLHDLAIWKRSLQSNHLGKGLLINRLAADENFRARLLHFDENLFPDFAEAALLALNRIPGDFCALVRSFGANWKGALEVADYRFFYGVFRDRRDLLIGFFENVAPNLSERFSNLETLGLLFNVVGNVDIFVLLVRNFIDSYKYLHGVVDVMIFPLLFVALEKEKVKVAPVDLAARIGAQYSRLDDYQRHNLPEIVKKLVVREAVQFEQDESPSDYTEFVRREVGKDVERIVAATENGLVEERNLEELRGRLVVAFKNVRPGILKYGEYTLYTGLVDDIVFLLNTGVSFEEILAVLAGADLMKEKKKDSARSYSENPYRFHYNDALRALQRFEAGAHLRLKSQFDRHFRKYLRNVGSLGLRILNQVEGAVRVVVERNVFFRMPSHLAEGSLMWFGPNVPWVFRYSASPEDFEINLSAMNVEQLRQFDSWLLALALTDIFAVNFSNGRLSIGFKS